MRIGREMMAARIRQTMAAFVLATLAGFALVQAQTVEQAAEPRVLASNGAVVAMPKIETLPCTGMAETLRRIDMSNYRGPAPVPVGHPDTPIFDYEDKLASFYYQKCVVGGQGLGDPGKAFSFGFKIQ